MKINCKKCGSKSVQKYGKSRQDKQRYQCKSCGRVYVNRNIKNKQLREREWFKLWIKEGYNLRQLGIISGHSREKIKLIKSHWLKQSVPILCSDYKAAKYLIFDGTYFNKKHCLLVFMNNADVKTIDCRYLDKESYKNVLDFSQELKSLGVSPKSITLDGHQAVIRAIKDVWPEVIIQRCLYHMQRQGLMWLRRRPKTRIGVELRGLIKSIGQLKTETDKEHFTNAYISCIRRNTEGLNTLKGDEAGIKDIKKIVALINNAYADMWHFLEDKNIPSTTNKLEGYFGQLKQQYVKHKGMWAKSREAYLKWYCYYKNN